MFSVYHLPILLITICLGCLILSQNTVVNLGWILKIEKRYCVPIRTVYNLSWIRVSYLMMASMTAGAFGFFGLYFLSNSSLIGGIGFICGVLLPVMAFEIAIQKIITDQEASLSLMFGMLKRWASIHPDLIQCLSRVAEEPLTPALGIALKRLLLSVQHGVEIEKAFDDFSLALDMPLFRDFMIHLKFSARSRGDLVKLFDSFEQESYRLYFERSKNRLENKKFKWTVYILNSSAISLFLMMVSRQPHVRQFYLQSTAGIYITTGLSVMVLLTTCLAIFSGAPGGIRGK
ncbi:hypothetical protein [Acidaminobacter hydrogenoformans]|uniref:Flp pilus assembly protein TadB n=1 Tax=Acidaminobacter hydrogenoformans DSM 2784 TaxID=1120920 RepID=A0A1G5RRK6_9FIRM|nr:hypothetical protein [Acidaminobacter hydrogenoformans]SCZ76647.1 hypothetical protein SAMN03080599_00350 [Acidaminobacter hydrogenoformans DSM 2784]